MPAMLRIDTLKFAKRLTDAGMDRRQAEALVEGLNEADTSEFATKADIGDVKAEIAEVKAEIAECRPRSATEIKADIAALRTETEGRHRRPEGRAVSLSVRPGDGRRRPHGRADRGAHQAPAVSYARGAQERHER